jgi:hypothetical protein
MNGEPFLQLPFKLRCAKMMSRTDSVIGETFFIIQAESECNLTLNENV